MLLSPDKKHRAFVYPNGYRYEVKSQELSSFAKENGNSNGSEWMTVNDMRNLRGRNLKKAVETALGFQMFDELRVKKECFEHRILRKLAAIEGKLDAALNVKEGSCR
jgi:hypothetical protein